jgi:O-antigen/teichoic acid export membrane protein
VSLPSSLLSPSPGEGDGRVRERGPGGEGRLRTWVKILSAYFTAQTLTQLAGIAAGLLYVNFMPVGEFALYTLASSVITFFTFASDLGSTTSLVHFYQRARSEGGEGDDFPRYLSAVLSLRRTAFLLGTAAVAVSLPWIATARGFLLRDSLLATAAVVLCVWFQIDASIRVLALRLADRYALSYRAELAGGAVRLLAAAAMVASALLWGWLGVFASAAGAATVAVLARPAEPIQRPADPQPYRRAVLRYLLPTLPGALYFSIQAPLTVWLAATFGAARNIAEVGALGRLGLVVGIFASLTGVVFLPRLARITDERLYLRRGLQFGAALLALAAGMLAAAALAPGLFLLLLGDHYAGLHRELLLVVGGAGLALLDGYVVAINLARGWTRRQGLAVICLIAVQAALAALLPLSTTAGVLAFNLLSSAAALTCQLAIAWAGFTRPHWVHWK